MFLHFRQTFPNRLSEWMLGVILLNWGLMLLRPEVSFSTPSYEALARIASENTWGWFCLMAGLVRLLALFINGMWTPSYHYRAGTAFISCFFWLQISLGFIAGGAATTGLAVYPVFLIADMFNVYRSARDYKYAKLTNGG